MDCTGYPREISVADQRRNTPDTAEPVKAFQQKTRTAGMQHFSRQKDAYTLSTKSQRY